MGREGEFRWPKISFKNNQSNFVLITIYFSKKSTGFLHMFDLGLTYFFTKLGRVNFSYVFS